jgi:hypothetical protein
MAQKELTMKKCLSSVLVFCAAPLFLSTMDVQAASSWQKYIAADKIFSFHYPRGWKVVTKESTFDITNAAAAPEVALPASEAIERGGSLRRYPRRGQIQYRREPDQAPGHDEHPADDLQPLYVLSRVQKLDLLTVRIPSGS